MAKTSMCHITPFKNETWFEYTYMHLISECIADGFMVKVEGQGYFTHLISFYRFKAWRYISFRNFPLWYDKDNLTYFIKYNMKFMPAYPEIFQSENYFFVKDFVVFHDLWENIKEKIIQFYN